MADQFVYDQAALYALFESPDGAVGKEVARRTVQVEGAAIRYCPVDTGRLRSSITHELGQDGGDIVGRVGTNVDYGVYVELGTSRAAAQLFLRPALGAAR